MRQKSLSNNVLIFYIDEYVQDFTFTKEMEESSKEIIESNEDNIQDKKKSEIIKHS